MSCRGERYRPSMENIVREEPEKKKMSASSDPAATLARTLSDSSTVWRSHSRTRSSTDHDVTAGRDEAKSRAKVAGILGFEDNPPRPTRRQTSTSRSRGLPLRSATRSSTGRSISPPIAGDISPITTASAFHRSNPSFVPVWHDTWIWYGGGRTPQRYRGFNEVGP